jgi:hypothetical protein
MKPNTLTKLQSKNTIKTNLLQEKPINPPTKLINPLHNTHYTKAVIGLWLFAVSS